MRHQDSPQSDPEIVKSYVSIISDDFDEAIGNKTEYQDENVEIKLLIENADIVNEEEKQDASCKEEWVALNSSNLNQDVDVNMVEKQEDVKMEEKQMDVNMVEKQEDVKMEEKQMDVNMVEKQEDVKMEEKQEDVNIEEKNKASSELDEDEDEIEIDKPISIDEEEAYDTDLEADDNEKSAYKTITAQDLYFKACDQLGVVPATYFVNNLNKEAVDLSHHGLGPKGAKALAAPLVVNTSILELNLADNWITAEGMKDLSDMLVENCFITNLNLSCNKLGKEGAMYASTMIRENTNIRQLDLSRNDFQDNDGEHIADALKMNLRIKELNLSGNAFCEVGGEWMGQAIANNEAIETLNLSWNHLRRKGALAICAGMKANITIKYLDLSWNGFCDDGAMAMGLALKANNTLMWLDLSHNRISDKGAVMLAKGLEINDTLKTLKLAHNPIGVAGSTALINAISKNLNSAMEEIDINGVQINEFFLREAQNLKEQSKEPNSNRAGFAIYLNPTDVSAQNRKKFSRVIGSPDPMDVIQKFLEDKRLRLIDLFRNFDKDLSWKISPAEFKKGILDAGVPLSKQQMKKLMKSLDIDKDGQVNYREFFAGKKKALLRRREMLRKEAKEKTQRKKGGKKMWGAWENAIQLTSSSSNVSRKNESSTLRSKSLIIPGVPQSRSKKSDGAKSNHKVKTTIIPITPRLTKSFVDSTYPNKEENLGGKFGGTHFTNAPDVTSSVTSIEKLSFDKKSSSSLEDLSIQVPALEGLKIDDDKKSLLSVDSNTPRRSGGVANSRKRPPS